MLSFEWKKKKKSKFTRRGLLPFCCKKQEEVWREGLLSSLSFLCFTQCYRWEYFCLGFESNLDKCHLRSWLLYILLFTNVWVICTWYCSSSVFQPWETVHVLNNFAPSLQQSHWQALLLAHSWRDSQFKGWLPHLLGQMLSDHIPHTAWHCTAP